MNSKAEEFLDKLKILAVSRIDQELQLKDKKVVEESFICTMRDARSGDPVIYITKSHVNNFLGVGNELAQLLLTNPRVEDGFVFHTLLRYTD